MSELSLGSRAAGDSLDMTLRSPLDLIHSLYFCSEWLYSEPKDPKNKNLMNKQRGARHVGDHSVTARCVCSPNSLPSNLLRSLRYGRQVPLVTARARGR